MRQHDSNSISSERNAVRLKSGEPVSHSGPGLREPTLPVIADRTSAACLMNPQSVFGSGGFLQPKSGRGLGQSPMSAEGALPLPLLESADVAGLVEFFLLLDAWDRRRNDAPVM